MPTLAAYFHTLSPFIVRFTDTFGIRWYGMAYLAGFLAAYLILRHLARRGLIMIPIDRVGDAMLWLIGGTLIGGRLGYAIFYDDNHHLLTGFSSSFPFWQLFAINKGGMASHGGIIGLIVACWRISRGWTDDTGRTIGRCPFMHVLDCATLVSPVGVFFGRVANFINGELLGAVVAKPGTPGPWWSVQFPQELDQPTRLAQTPEQWEQIRRLAAQAAPHQPVEVGVQRLIQNASQYADQLRPLIAARHPSQMYQAVAEGVLVGVVLWVAWARPRKPGVIAAIFLIVYGVGRILTELIRLPDAHLAVERFAGLSRGQWLSVVMLVAGAWLLWFAATRPVGKLGGWRETGGSAGRGLGP